MLFEREAEVLNWYEKQERILTSKFLQTIPWQKVKDHIFDPILVPTLLYFRDVERFTDVYHAELQKTPTGKDPIIKRFMDRWSTEELTHADLLNRFVNELGYSTSQKWIEEARAKIPLSYKLTSRLSTRITNLIGKPFSAVHMTWGAIQEYTTLTGYERLWKMANHPVLEYIMKAIAREEAMHSFFYWSVARINLMKSDFRKRLTNFIIKTFWSPVGEGSKPTNDTNLVIRSLFAGSAGTNLIDQRVTRRIQQLPGLQDLVVITDRIRSVAEA